MCNKTKKVICISCNDKHCEGVIKLKASINASQEASLKEAESEGSTQQIKEAGNADKQKLADDLIKPNYLLLAFITQFSTLFPFTKKEKSANVNILTNTWMQIQLKKIGIKKIPLLTPMHVQYVSIYYCPTKGKCKCQCKKYYTSEEHLIVIYKDTQLFTVKHLLDLLTKIQYNKVSMYSMTCASNLSSNILTNTKLVNPDILRIALHKFINMLKFDKKKTWDCTYCKHTCKLVWNTSIFFSIKSQ